MSYLKWKLFFHSAKAQEDFSLILSVSTFLVELQEKLPSQTRDYVSVLSTLGLQQFINCMQIFLPQRVFGGGKLFFQFWAQPFAPVTSIPWQTEEELFIFQFAQLFTFWSDGMVTSDLLTRPL